MAYTSNSEFDAETRVQKTNEVRPLDIYEGVHSILKRDIWKWLLGWSDTTTDLKYDMERAKNDPTYNYTDDLYPAKIVNGVPAPEYGEDLVQTKWNPNRKDELGNPIAPGYEEVPAENQTRMEIDGALLPEHDLFLHEIYRYLNNLYPDHPDWIELLTHTEIIDAFENAAAMVDYKPDDKFFLLVAQNMEGISDMKDANGNQIDEVKKEELKLLLRNLTNNSFRRKFYGASDGMKMFSSGVSELSSVFPVGEYLPIEPLKLDDDNVEYDEEDIKSNVPIIKDPTKLNIDIFDPNFKKPFRIIDWDGKSRDIPKKEESLIPINGYSIPGCSKEIIEMHNLDDANPMSNSAESNINSRTFFRIPNTNNGIAYYNGTDTSQIKSYSKINYSKDGKIVNTETIKPYTPIIKYKATLRLPVVYDTLYNYGKIKTEYDFTDRRDTISLQKIIFNNWKDVDIKDEKQIAEKIFNVEDTGALNNLIALIFNEADNKKVRYTIDPSTNGLILEPSNMLNLYGNEPSYEYDEELKQYNLLEDMTDNEAQNPNLKNLPFKKEDIISSNEIINNFSYYSFYSYIGTNKGKITLKVNPFYKDGDTPPSEFGEFTDSLLTSDYTSKEFSYGLIINTAFDEKVVLYGSIHPIWDVATEYIQAVTIDFNIQNIPMYKDDELLKYLYGKDYKSKYSLDEITHFRKNRELFSFVESKTLAKVEELFKEVDFINIDLEKDNLNVNLNNLIKAYDDEEFGQFLIYQYYMNTFCNLCLQQNKPLPEIFTFATLHKGVVEFKVKNNQKTINTPLLEILKDNSTYELNGDFLENNDVLKLKFINDFEIVSEDFTFGKGSTVEKVFVIYPGVFPSEEGTPILTYENLESIPNTSVISQFDIGHLNVIEWGENFNEDYSFVHKYNKSSQNEPTEKITIDNFKKYYDYDVFDINILSSASTSHKIKAAFPKIIADVSKSYEKTNSLKLNILGNSLWNKFLNRVSPENNRYIAETLIPVPLEIEATRESDANNDDALKTLVFSGEENMRKYEALTTGDTVEGNGIPSGTYIIQKNNGEVLLNNKIPKSGTYIYKFNCIVEAYPTDIREDFINYKERLRDVNSLESTSPFENGLWGSDEWPHVSQAYIDGLVDPQDFSPVNPQQTANIIYENKLSKFKTTVNDAAAFVPLSSVSIGTKMYYEINCKKLINLPNRLGQVGNLMNVEWLDYFDSNMNTIAQANESTNVGTNLMMQTDISGFFTHIQDADYTDEDLKVKFQTFGYNDSTVPCYIQLGTGGTAYQRYFKSPSLVQKPTTYGAAFFDHPTPNIKQIQDHLVHEGGDWKKRFVYSIGDISVTESGSGLYSVDQPLFEMPLGEYDVQKNFTFEKEDGVNTGNSFNKMRTDTISASFQKQTFKDLTKQLPENAIQVLNHDFIESKFIEDTEHFIYRGEWKPSIKISSKNGKSFFELKYPDMSDIQPDKIEEDNKYYVYSVTDAFSDFISDEEGNRQPINIPATSLLIYYKNTAENTLQHMITVPDFAGVTFNSELKDSGASGPYLQKEIKNETGSSIVKYIPIYSIAYDNELSRYDQFSIYLLSGNKTYTCNGKVLNFSSSGTLKIGSNIYYYNAIGNEINIIDKGTIHISPNSSDFSIITINDDTGLNLNGQYTLSEGGEVDFTTFKEKINAFDHAAYIMSVDFAGDFSTNNFFNELNGFYKKFFTNENSKIPVLAIVSSKEGEELDKNGKKVKVTHLVLNYNVLYFHPINSWKETVSIKERDSYFKSMPIFMPLYEGLFASSVSWNSNTHAEELSFFDGTFGKAYITQNVTGKEQEYVEVAVDSGLRIIQDHQNKLKLPRSFVADGSYNIELTLDPNFISQGYLYNEAKNTIINEKESDIVNFNVSQNKIYYDDINHAFYTYADLYNKIEPDNKSVDESCTYIKDETQLNKKVALKFEEQKFFKDTTYLNAALKAYNVQKEGNKDTEVIYSLEPVKGIPYNTSKYSSSDRVLDIQEVKFRNEPDYNCEPVLFSNFTTLKGEVVGINENNKLVVGNFRKSASSAMTEATSFAQGLKEIDPVNDVHNIKKSCPPTLSDLKIKKPFTGEEIDATEGPTAEMNFKFYKNYLVFEGAIDTTAPEQIIASKNNAEEFEKVLKTISAGDEIKAASCLNAGSNPARKSIKVTQPDFKIPQVIRWEKGNLIMVGKPADDPELYIYTKKVPSLEAISELNGLTLSKINIDKDAKVKDVTRVKETGNWMITLENASSSVLEINPNIKGSQKPIEKYIKAESDLAKEFTNDVLIYNKNKFTFDKFKAEDISIVDVRKEPTDESRTLYYKSNNGSYNEKTLFYVDISMQQAHLTQLANGIDGLDISTSVNVNLNNWSIEEKYKDWHVENAPYPEYAEEPTEEGRTEKILDVPVVYSSNSESGDEVFIQGDNLFVKTDKIYSSIDERQRASQKYWLKGKIPAYRDTLEQRIHSIDPEDLKAKGDYKGLLPAAIDEVIKAYNNSEEEIRKNWNELDKKVQETYVNGIEDYVEEQLKLMYSEFEYFLFTTCKLESKFRSQIVDLTTFENNMTKVDKTDKNNKKYKVWQATYKLPLKEVNGKQAVVNEEVSHTYETDNDSVDKKIFAYQEYCKDWLLHVFPAIDNTIAGENFILSSNVSQAIINKSEVGSELVLPLKNNQVIKLDLDKVQKPDDIGNADYWSSYELPEKTFYLSKDVMGTAYISRNAVISESEGVKEYVAPSVTHIKPTFEITNTYKFGSNIVMSGYLEKKKNIEANKLGENALSMLGPLSEYRKPFLMYTEPGNKNLTMIDISTDLEKIKSEKVQGAEKEFTLGSCDLTIGSVSTLNGKLVATLSPLDDTSVYFNSKIEISKGDLPGDSNTTAKEIPNTKTLGGANQVMIGASNSILYWQETGKGIINENDTIDNNYYFDYLYKGAVSFGEIPSISFTTDKMIQLTEGLQADENTAPAYYRYLFAVKTHEQISNPFEYYKYSEEYIDPDTNLLKVGEVQEEVGSETLADKVYMYRECKSIEDPSENGYPAMEEDTEKQFYKYDDEGNIVYWQNSSGKPLYLCNEDGDLISAIYTRMETRHESIGLDNAIDDSWQNLDGALYKFDSAPESEDDSIFRKAGMPALKDINNFTETFEILREDEEFRKEVGNCNIESWNSNFGGQEISTEYFPSVTLSSTLANEKAEKYLMEIKSEDIYNNFVDNANKDIRSAEMYLSGEKEKAEEALNYYYFSEEEPKAMPPEMEGKTFEEKSKAQDNIETIDTILGLIRFIEEKEGDFGTYINPFTSWTERFIIKEFNGKKYIFDKKYNVFMLNKVRYVEGLLKVLYPSSVPVVTRVVTSYKGLYDKEGKLLGVGPDNKYPVTGIYYPQKGYGGLMNDTEDWSATKLPWKEGDIVAFSEENLMNTETQPCEVLLFDKNGHPILNGDDIIISKAPAYNSFEDLVSKIGRSVTCTKKVDNEAEDDKNKEDINTFVEAKDGSILSFGGISPTAIEVFFGENFPKDLKVEPGKEKYIRIRVLSIADTTDIEDLSQLNRHDENYKAFEEVSKDEFEIFPPNRVYFNKNGIPLPPISGTQFIAANDEFAPKEMLEMRKYVSSKIFRSKNNYAFFANNYTNNNGIPIYQCNENGEYIKYYYDDELPIEPKNFKDEKVAERTLENNEISYTNGVLFNPKKPIYNTCEEWFKSEFYIKGQESNPFWQVIKVYPEFNTNTMRFDSKSKIFEYNKASETMQLVECSPEDTYVMMKKTTLRKTEGTKTTVIPNASYIDLLPGEVYFLLSQPENETFKNEVSFVKYGISYINSFNTKTGIHKELWEPKHFINLPSSIKVSYTINTTEDFANPDNKDAGIVRVSELALLDKNHQIVAYATFPPIEYRSDTQHISFTCFINKLACADYHNKNKSN